jgi:hypothetical protein
MLRRCDNHRIGAGSVGAKLARSKLWAKNYTSPGFGSTVVALVLWPERKAQTDGSQIESANAGAIPATGRANAVEAQNASVF